MSQGIAEHVLKDKGFPYFIPFQRIIIFIVILAYRRLQPCAISYYQMCLEHLDQRQLKRNER